MREAIGTTTIFKMVLIFTLLFAAFLAIAVTYNKVYKLKNETISIIEKYEGFNESSIKIINNYLKNSGYNEKSNCNKDEFGVKSLEENSYEAANEGEKYYYCISHTCNSAKCVIGNNNKIYYDIRLFFKFNLPFLGDLVTFNIKGETKEIVLYSENQKLK